MPPNPVSLRYGAFQYEDGAVYIGQYVVQEGRDEGTTTLDIILTLLPHRQFQAKRMLHGL
jgi:hypothetical protein